MLENLAKRTAIIYSWILSDIEQLWVSTKDTRQGRISSLYKDQEAVIRWNSEHSQPFLIRKGVSPHLFILYTEEIMRDAEVEKYGINFEAKKISNLRFADDTALCTVPETRKNQ